MAQPKTLFFRTNEAQLWDYTPASILLVASSSLSRRFGEKSSGIAKFGNKFSLPNVDGKVEGWIISKAKYPSAQKVLNEFLGTLIPGCDKKGDEDKVLNPETGRYVKADGPTGKRILAQQASPVMTIKTDSFEEIASCMKKKMTTVTIKKLSLERGRVRILLIGPNDKVREWFRQNTKEFEPSPQMSKEELTISNQENTACIICRSELLS